MKLTHGKILVTGADGFIGSHLTETLIKNGYNVRAFVFYNSFNSWGWLDSLDENVKKSLDVFTGDIRDPHGIKQAMKGCDMVFHLAALIAIPFSYHSPDAYVDTNIKGTLNILQAARDLGTSKIISTSTSEVYGTARFVPITEEHPLQGQSPYSATKIGADQIAMSFFQSFNTPVSIIRPFNTFGPRQSARAIIPTIITQIASGKKTIKLGSLHPTRDLNYVPDVVQGFIAVGGSQASLGHVINIGNGFEISIGDLTQTIAEMMDTEVKVELEDNRIRPEKSEVERLLADNTKAKKLLGWEPTYKGLDGLKKGLKETIQWFTRPENIKLYKSDRYNI